MHASVDLLALRDPLATLCREAGHAVLDIYDRPWEEQGIQDKADDSPLTEADIASHEILAAALPPLGEGWPVVSEEGDKTVPPGPYWLVDPLDGTKEFIKRNGEFTINVALVEEGKPLSGIVHVPVTGTTYYGIPGHGAWRDQGDGWEPIQAATVQGEVVAVVSKSHRGEAVDVYLDNIRKAGHDVQDVSFGSSIKLCKVAEGAAHVYPRLGPTMPWDTAAAHAVVLGAGGSVTDVGGNALRYHAMELNPWFIVGCKGMDWARFADAVR